jgi:hypothetical protein
MALLCHRLMQNADGDRVPLHRRLEWVEQHAVLRPTKS